MWNLRKIKSKISSSAEYLRGKGKDTVDTRKKDATCLEVGDGVRNLRS